MSASLCIGPEMRVAEGTLAARNPDAASRSPRAAMSSADCAFPGASSTSGKAPAAAGASRTARIGVSRIASASAASTPVDARNFR